MIGEGNGTPLQYSWPGKSHGWRSLVGCSPWGRQELDTTERLHFHFSLSCIEEGNGNALQYSCLKNSMNKGAWWATVHGVTKSPTQQHIPDLEEKQIAVLDPCNCGMALNPQCSVSGRDLSVLICLGCCNKLYKLIAQSFSCPSDVCFLICCLGQSQLFFQGASIF